MRYQNFQPYNQTIKRNDISFFENTEFITNDDFIEGHAQQPHVSMWEVHGIRFKNCHFANNITANKSTSGAPNEGLTALDASFKVVPSCAVVVPTGSPCPTASTLRSSFTGLEFAVKIAGAAGSEVATVTQSDFTNNVWGVVVDEFDLVNINRNDITIGNGGYFNSLSAGNGIYLDNSSAYIVEENKVVNTLNTGKTSGIVVVNGGEADNRVYKNELNNLFVGTQANKVNRQLDLELHTGLQFLCNDYIQNGTAISVNYNVLNQVHGIKVKQGVNNPKTSAGNTFNGNNIDIANNTNSHFNYYHSGGFTEPVNNSSLNNLLIVPNAAENLCRTSFPGGITLDDTPGPFITGLIVKLDSITQVHDNLNYNYISLIDNGNTDVLQNQIENNWSNDAWTMRNNLMQESPYLSDEALLTAASEDVMPHAMLLEVLLANPDATKGEHFIKELDEVTNYTMPAYMLDYVRNSWDTETIRTTLVGELMNLKTEIANTTKFIKVIENSKDQYTYASRDSIVQMGTGLSNEIEQIDFYISNEEWLKADSVLTAVQSNDEYEGDVGLVEDFDTYITFRSGLGTRSIAQLDSSEISYLETLAEQGNRASGYAENILCFFYDICYDKPVTDGNTMAKMMSIPTGDKPSLEEILYDINVYPNPASNYANIQWEIYDEINNANYKVFDMNGRELSSGNITANEGEKVIDTRELKSGIYLVNIYNDGNLKMNTKLVVEKNK